jgi:hypothetical protein
LESDVELPSVTDGAISNMWKQENHFSSSARTSEPKRQRISELVTELRNLTKTDDNQSDEEISTSAPVASKGSVKMSNHSTNQRPYNVIFESDEAISVSTTEGKDPRIRVPRSKIPGSFSHNEGRDSGNGSSVILALKNGSLSDDGELQKILDVWYGQLRQALMVRQKSINQSTSHPVKQFTFNTIKQSIDVVKYTITFIVHRVFDFEFFTYSPCFFVVIR